MASVAVAERKRGCVTAEEFREVTVMGSHIKYGLVGCGQDFGQHMDPR